MRSRTTVVLVLMLALTQVSCAGAYKRSVELWASDNLREYAQLAKNSTSDDAELAVALQSIADLQCTIDEDKKSSVEGKPSLACRCATSPDEAARVVACKEWLQSLGVE